MPVPATLFTPGRCWPAIEAVLSRPGTASVSSLLLIAAGALAFLMPKLAPLVAIIGAFYAMAFVMAAATGLLRQWRSTLKLNRIFYCGTVRGSYEPVWITNDDLRARNLMVLTGGASGQRQMLELGAFNAIGQNGGLMYVSSSGDLSVYRRIFEIAEGAGREDDVLAINLVSKPQVDAPASHAFNPFASGTADSLSLMVMSALDKDMDPTWRGRATALLTSVMRALVWERDNGVLELNAATIRVGLQFSRVVDFTEPGRMPQLPSSIRAGILDYLNCLPGFHIQKGKKQAQTTLDQHGFLQTYLSRMLNVLADVHGHVFLNYPDVDIDMRDVVLNRRILVVILPPFEKAPGEMTSVSASLIGSLRAIANEMVSGGTPGYWASGSDRNNAGVAPFTVVFEDGGSEPAVACGDLARQASLLNMQFLFGFDSLDHAAKSGLPEYLVRDSYRLSMGPKQTALIEMPCLREISLPRVDHLPRRLTDAFLPLRRTF